MPIEAVQSYNSQRSSNNLSNIFTGSVLGIAGGLITRQILPLSAEENKEIPRRSLVISARKETNRRMVEQIKALEKPSVAQDRFVKMIAEKDFKSSKEIGNTLMPKEVAEEFKRIIKVVDKDSSALSRRLAVNYARMIKGARPYMGFVLGGGVIGALSGIFANMVNRNSRI